MKKLIIILEIITGIIVAIILRPSDFDPFGFGLIFTILGTPLVIFITLAIFKIFEKDNK